jgi:hypothetical protein
MWKNFFFHLLTTLCFSLDCLTWHCSDLEIGTCALRRDSTILVNTHYCAGNQVCQLQEILSSNTTDLFQCTEKRLALEPLVPDYSLVRDILNKDYCLKELDKDLESGSHPKECERDSDCMLKDGSYSHCVCGFNKGYCRPEWSSSYFDEWLNNCSQELEITLKLKDFFNVFVYYPYLVSMHDIEGDCLSAAFTDLWDLEEVFYDVSNKEYFEEDRGSSARSLKFEGFRVGMSVLVILLIILDYTL